MKLHLIILILIIPSVIFAQSNYHEGYVVKSNGDTLKGYVDYREWSQSPVQIDFKVSKSDGSQQFNPSNCKGFGVDGMETYISYSEPISMDRNHFPNLSEKLDTSKAQASVFLRQVTAGSYLSLYSQTDNIKTRYFIAEANAIPEELKYNQYYDNQHEVVERAIYRGQLLFYINKYAPGNAKLRNGAEDALFEDDPLADVVNKINGGTSTSVKNQPTVRPKLRVFAGAGLSYGDNPVGFTGNSTPGFPQLTIGIDKFDNPNVQQFIFRTSLTVASTHSRINYPMIYGDHNVLTYDQLTLGISPQLIYNVYNKDSFKVFIGLGASLNLSDYSNVAHSAYSEPKPSVDFSTFWVNIPLQAGIVVNKRFELAFTYAPYTKITPTSNNAFASHSIGLGVNIYLSK
jgi:hypothetical protein